MKTNPPKNQIVITFGATAAFATGLACLFFIWLSGIEWGRNIPFAIAVVISLIFMLGGAATGVGFALRIIQFRNSKIEDTAIKELMEKMRTK